jgi:DNA-binding MurR/RpiR family transcriptional regulator
MELEMRNEPEDLQTYNRYLMGLHVPRLNPSETIFTGSGDSYAAALFARQLSGGLALAEDPYEVWSNPTLARGRSVVLISVSGRTRSNVTLAQRLRKVAGRRIAITSDPDSPLAQQCDSSIILRYRKAGKLTSGTTSFTASLLASACLIGRGPGRLTLTSSLEKSREWAEDAGYDVRGSFLFIGSGVGRALAEYGTCKVHEVLGSRADAQYPEQVGHAQLFSLDPRKDTVVCVGTSKSRRTWEVARAMSRAGFRVLKISAGEKNVLTWSLVVSFHLQNLALAIARRLGMTECAFLSDKTRLRVSNKLIY